jgi:hypothetical protein
MTTADAMFAAMGRTGHGTGSAAWIGYVASTLFLVALVCGAWWFAVWSVRRWEIGGEDSDDGGNGGGGGHPSPPSRSPETEPGWWPEFEREFEAYIKATSRKAI